MSKSLRKGLFSFIVLLIIYQDSPLGLYAGAFGYSFVPIFSLMLFAIIILIEKGKVLKDKYIKGFVRIFIYLTIVSFVAVIVWAFMGKPLVILHEDIFSKTFKGLLYFLSYICFLYDMKYLSQYMGKNEFVKPIFIVFILLTLIAIIEYFTLPNAFSFLHFTGGKHYGRIRLLSKESSWTSMTIFVYGILSLYYSFIKRNKLYLYLTIICFAILILLTSSKTLLIVFFIALIIALMINAKKMTKKSIVISIILLALGLGGYFLLSGKLSSAIERSLQWSSIFTRVYTILIGLIIGVVYPLGTGTAIYLKVFPDFLKKYLYLIKTYDNGYSLREIKSYIYANSSEYIAVKSGLLHYNMYWGIIGTIWFLKVFILNIYVPFVKLNENYSLVIQVGLIVSIIMLLFSTSFTFEFWLMISFAIFCLNKQ